MNDMKYVLVYGIQPIYEILKYRHNTICEIFILITAEKLFKNKFLIELIKKRRVKLTFIDKNHMNKLFGAKKYNHQNIIAIIKKTNNLNFKAFLITKSLI